MHHIHTFLNYIQQFQPKPFPNNHSFASSWSSQTLNSMIHLIICTPSDTTVPKMHHDCLMCSCIICIEYTQTLLLLIRSVHSSSLATERTHSRASVPRCLLHQSKTGPHTPCQAKLYCSIQKLSKLLVHLSHFNRIAIPVLVLHYWKYPFSTYPYFTNVTSTSPSRIAQIPFSGTCQRRI